MAIVASPYLSLVGRTPGGDVGNDHVRWMPLPMTPADPAGFSTDLRDFGNDLVGEAANEAGGVGDVWQRYHVDEIAQSPGP
jgi:hypothetical protein